LLLCWVVVCKWICVGDLVDDLVLVCVCDVDVRVVEVDVCVEDVDRGVLVVLC